MNRVLRRASTILPLALLLASQVTEAGKRPSYPPNCLKRRYLSLYGPGKDSSHPEVRLTDALGFRAAPEQKIEILAALDRLAAMTRPEDGPRTLLLPTDLTVELGPPSSLAGHQGGYIRMPVEFRSVPYRKHPDTTRTVFEHEWGHEFLEANIRRRFPDVVDAVDRRKGRIQGHEREVRDSASEVQRLEHQPDPPSVRERLEKARSALQAAKEALQGERSKLAALKGIFRPYSEFFADIIPVLARNDGKATAAPLFSAAKLPQGNFDAFMRDFTRRHPAEDWEYEGVYASLAPTRSWLWETYLSIPRVQARIPDTLDAIVDAIGLETQRRTLVPDATLTPEQINIHLQSEITRQMQARGF